MLWSQKLWSLWHIFQIYGISQHTHTHTCNALISKSSYHKLSPVPYGWDIGYGGDMWHAVPHFHVLALGPLSNKGEVSLFLKWFFSHP